MLGWRDAHPDVDLDGVEADRSALLAGLDTGEIDIAILMGEAARTGYRREPFWSERMLVALPSNHPLTEREVIHWTDLRGERVLLTSADPGPQIRDIVLGRLAASGVKPDIRIHHASRETILSTLGGGLAVSVICEGTTGAHYPDVVYRPIHGEQGSALIGYSGYWLSSIDNPALKRFLAFVRNRFALSFDMDEVLEEKVLSSSGEQPS